MLFELVPDKKHFVLTGVSDKIDCLTEIGYRSTYPFTIIKYIEKEKKNSFDFCVTYSTLHNKIDVQDMQTSILNYLKGMLNKIENN